MGDCHSFDPGSNPGPGAVFSVRIPTSTKKNNKETINETAKNTHSVDDSDTIINTNLQMTRN